MHTAIYYALIFIYLLDLVWTQWLALLNRRRMNPTMPEALIGIYEEADYARQQSYTCERLKIPTAFAVGQRKQVLPARVYGKFKCSPVYQAANSRAAQFERLILALVNTAILIFGGFGLFDLWLRARTENFLLLPLVYVGCVSLVGGILSLPFDVYGTFVIEGRFGFNKITPRLFVMDLLKKTILYVVLGGAILVVMVLLHNALGAWFWLPAWIVVSLFSLFFAYFYSELIVPLFNKQEALADGSLRRAIEAFAERTGFRLENICVMDGSKRSTKANAYFTGFGGKKRVVLYDTLIAELEEDEIVAVLAHEIGHYRKKHVLVSVALSLASGFLLFLTLSFFVEQPAIARASWAAPSPLCTWACSVSLS
jgi:STE24 endopeptidase